MMLQHNPLYNWEIVYYIKLLGAEYFRLGYSIVPYERKKKFIFE